MPQNDWEENWEFVKELGGGGQGTVSLVRRRNTGTPEPWKDLQQSLLQLISNVHNTAPDHPTAAAKLVAAIDTIKELNEKDLGALKRLHNPENARDSENAVWRQQQEIDAIQKVTHPSLLQLLEVGKKKDWYISTYCAGGNLHSNQSRFAGNALLTLESIRPVVEAVAKLHEKQIVHRDIKPENVFINSDGKFVLGDFGLVFFTDSEEERKTRTNDNVGSWWWMPTWAQGHRLEEVTPAFDVLALGKVIWFSISGKRQLHLWYYQKDQNNLEKLFPGDPAMPIVNELLGSCIVEDESECISNANLLLTKLDAAIRRIRNSGRILYGDSLQEWLCRVCGNACYKCVVDRNNTSLQHFGLSPRGSRSFKVYACENCGHVEFFAMSGNTDQSAPSAWSNPKKPS